MKFNQDILFEFLTEDDKKSFLVWDNCFYNSDKSSIVCICRAPFEERIIVPVNEYKSLERNNKLKKIGI